MRFLRPILLTLALLIAVAAPLLSGQLDVAHAAASMYVSVPSSIKVGDTISISISVNTGGQSANAFEGHVSYPTGLFDGVRGTYSGSICTLPVTQPDPSGGSADFSCGTPNGFTGTGLVATIVLTAKAPGSGAIGLSSCSVLANDGRGTDISGGCSGSGITVGGAATPTPNTPPPATSIPTPTPTPTPVVGGGAKTPTPKASGTPTPTPKSTVTPTPSNDPNKKVTAEEKAATPTPTPNPGEPPVQTLAPTTSASAEPAASDQPESNGSDTTEKRTVSQAFRDLLGSFKEFGSLKKDVGGLIALLVTGLPFLLITLAVVYLFYRLYLLERRRKRTLDRLFEMELSELAALEGKLDLLGEKGVKGREQYREEFQKAKENILRQLRPDYGKPAGAAPEVKPEAKS